MGGGGVPVGFNWVELCNLYNPGNGRYSIEGGVGVWGEQRGGRPALHKHQTPELGGGVRLLGQFTAMLQLVPRCFGASGRARVGVETRASFYSISQNTTSNFAAPQCPTGGGTFFCVFVLDGLWTFDGIIVIIITITWQYDRDRCCTISDVSIHTPEYTWFDLMRLV